MSLLILVNICTHALKPAFKSRNWRTRLVFEIRLFVSTSRWHRIIRLQIFRSYYQALVYQSACVCHRLLKKQECGDIPPSYASNSAVPLLPRSGSLVSQPPQSAASPKLLPLLSHIFTTSCHMSNRQPYLLLYKILHTSETTYLHMYIYICLFNIFMASK